jgi:hypothetical protein
MGCTPWCWLTGRLLNPKTRFPSPANEAAKAPPTYPQPAISIRYIEAIQRLPIFEACINQATRQNYTQSFIFCPIIFVIRRILE